MEKVYNLIKHPLFQAYLGVTDAVINDIIETGKIANDTIKIANTEYTYHCYYAEDFTGFTISFYASKEQNIVLSYYKNERMQFEFTLTNRLNPSVIYDGTRWVGYFQNKIHSLNQVIDKVFKDLYQYFNAAKTVTSV